MFMDREYVPLSIVAHDKQMWCGGYGVYDQIQDGDQQGMFLKLCSAFRADDTKHQFINSFLPLFEMKDEEYYLPVDYIYANTTPPHVLGTEPDDGILGLYKQVHPITGNAVYEYFEKRADFYLNLVNDMDNDCVRFVPDILEYTKRLIALKSRGVKRFANDIILFPFTVENKYRVVENIYIPFILTQFKLSSAKSDKMLTVQYTVDPRFLDSDEGIGVIINGLRTFVKTINLNFSDLCAMLKDESAGTVYYIDLKTSKDQKHFNKQILRYYDKHKVSLTEIEPEE